MPKQHKRTSDIVFDVRKKSAIARNNPSVALARFWMTQGVEFTPEQLVQIQVLDKSFKPQTVLREWQRQQARLLSTIKHPVHGHDTDLSRHALPVMPVQNPRKKFLGLF